MITAAFLRDAQGTAKDVFEWGEPVEVVVRLQLPDDIPRAQLGVAVSIKDLRGSDLLVCTTHDESARALPDDSGIEVGFRFTNGLTPGKYLLVAALERRQGTDIYYYEYIEGAQYFASTSGWRMFGVFRPDVAQRIETLAELDL